MPRGLVRDRKIAWIDGFFKFPAANLMVLLAATEFLISRRVA